MQYVAEEKKSNGLQKLLDAANKTIASLRAELLEYKSVGKQLDDFELKQENKGLKKTVAWYYSVIK